MPRLQLLPFRNYCDKTNRGGVGGQILPTQPDKQIRVKFLHGFTAHEFQSPTLTRLGVFYQKWAEKSCPICLMQVL